MRLAQGSPLVSYVDLVRGARLRVGSARRRLIRLAVSGLRRTPFRMVLAQLHAIGGLFARLIGARLGMVLTPGSAVFGAIYDLIGTRLCVLGAELHSLGIGLGDLIGARLGMSSAGGRPVVFRNGGRLGGRGRGGRTNECRRRGIRPT